MDEQRIVQPQLGRALGVPPINLDAIAQIESSGGKQTKSAISGDSIGTFQVRPIVAKEYKRVMKQDVDLTNPEQNKMVANWYLQDYIPKYLTSHNIPVVPNHIIASYNMGPAGFAKHYRVNKGDLSGLPSITAQYLKKYEKLTGGTDASISSMPTL
jgi:soluble lytic murein transglycosylase-like protein